MTENRLVFARASSLAAFLSLIPSLTFAAMSPEIMLQVAGGDESQFELTSKLNTLTPLVGTLSDTGIVSMNGNFKAVLDLSFSNGFANPNINGLQLAAGDLLQSAVGFQYPLEVGLVVFDTTDLKTQLSTGTGLLQVVGDEFAADAVQLIQNGGEAAVRVPQKPDARQNLEDSPVTSLLTGGPETSTVSVGRIDLELLNLDSEFATYRVELTIPLVGQSVAFNDVGLPVDLIYDHGTLVAIGSFQQAIPEPSTLLLTALMTLSVQTTRPRRRPLKNAEDPQSP